MTEFQESNAYVDNCQRSIDVLYTVIEVSEHFQEFLKLSSADNLLDSWGIEITLQSGSVDLHDDRIPGHLLIGLHSLQLLLTKRLEEIGHDTSGEPCSCGWDVSQLPECQHSEFNRYTPGTVIRWTHGECHVLLAAEADNIHHEDVPHEDVFEPPDSLTTSISEPSPYQVTNQQSDVENVPSVEAANHVIRFKAADSPIESNITIEEKKERNETVAPSVIQSSEKNEKPNILISNPGFSEPKQDIVAKQHCFSEPKEEVLTTKSAGSKVKAPDASLIQCEQRKNYNSGNVTDDYDSVNEGDNSCTLVINEEVQSSNEEIEQEESKESVKQYNTNSNSSGKFTHQTEKKKHNITSFKNVLANNDSESFDEFESKKRKYGNNPYKPLKKKSKEDSLDKTNFDNEESNDDQIKPSKHAAVTFANVLSRENVMIHNKKIPEKDGFRSNDDVGSRSEDDDSIDDTSSVSSSTSASSSTSDSSSSSSSSSDDDRITFKEQVEKAAQAYREAAAAKINESLQQAEQESEISHQIDTGNAEDNYGPLQSSEDSISMDNSINSSNTAMSYPHMHPTPSFEHYTTEQDYRKAMVLSPSPDETDTDKCKRQKTSLGSSIVPATVLPFCGKLELEYHNSNTSGSRIPQEDYQKDKSDEYQRNCNDNLGNITGNQVINYAKSSQLHYSKDLSSLVLHEKPNVDMEFTNNDLINDSRGNNYLPNTVNLPNLRQESNFVNMQNVPKGNNYLINKSESCISNMANIPENKIFNKTESCIINLNNIEGKNFNDIQQIHTQDNPNIHTIQREQVLIQEQQNIRSIQSDQQIHRRDEQEIHTIHTTSQNIHTIQSDPQIHLQEGQKVHNIHTNRQNMQSIQSDRQIHRSEEQDIHTIHTNSQNIHTNSQNIHTNSQNIHTNSQNIHTNSQNIHTIPSDRQMHIHEDQNIHSLQTEMLPLSLQSRHPDDLQAAHSLTALQKVQSLPMTSVNTMTIESTSAKKFECKICGKRFTRSSKLKQHQVTHTREKTFACNICEQKFTRHDSLKKHVKSKHTPSHLLFTCCICQKKFPTKSILNTHMDTHATTKPFSCDICGQTFALKGTRDTHLAQHTGERPWKCQICGRSYVTKYKLRAHMKGHTGELKCSFCGKLYTSMDTLRRHEVLHSIDDSKKKIPTCLICNKKFATASILKRHTSIHTDQQVFKCTLCKSIFTNQYHLNKHKLNNHGESSTTIEHDCSFCDAKFTKVPELVEHVSRVHSVANYQKLGHQQTSEHVCSYCDIEFAKLEELVEHTSNVHNVTNLPGNFPQTAINMKKTYPLDNLPSVKNDLIYVNDRINDPSILSSNICNVGSNSNIANNLGSNIPPTSLINNNRTTSITTSNISMNLNTNMSTTQNLPSNINNLDTGNIHSQTNMNTNLLQSNMYQDKPNQNTVIANIIDPYLNSNSFN